MSLSSSARRIFGIGSVMTVCPPQQSHKPHGR
jgi:hypothetical protein